MIFSRLLFVAFLILSGCSSETVPSSGPSKSIGNNETQSPSPRTITERAAETNARRIASLSTHSLSTDAVERPQIRVVEASWSNETEVNLYEPPEREPAHRSRRRMNIDQLEAAFLRVSDGLNWTERRNGQDESLFQTLAVTLGKPDFIQTTTEVLEPTALFQKFLDDAARQVCEKMVERDTSSENPILLPKEFGDDNLNEHLAQLVMRFHNRILAEDSRDLAQWRWLYDTVSAVENNQSLRWSTVCTALFTHPDFYSF